jgi:hypothetical protein
VWSSPAAIANRRTGRWKNALGISRFKEWNEMKRNESLNRFRLWERHSIQLNWTRKIGQKSRNCWLKRMIRFNDDQNNPQ